MIPADLKSIEYVVADGHNIRERASVAINSVLLSPLPENRAALNAFFQDAAAKVNVIPADGSNHLLPIHDKVADGHDIRRRSAIAISSTRQSPLQSNRDALVAFFLDAASKVGSASGAPTLRQVATGTLIPNFRGSSPNVTAVSRTPHVLKSDTSALAIVLPNWYVNDKLEAAAGSATWTAAIEYPAGVFQRVTFAGAASVTSATGGNIVSDQMSVAIPKGATFWIRLFQNAPSGVVFFNFYAGDGTAQFASPATDLTMGGAITTCAAIGANIQSPVAIVATSSDAAVGLYGDSISVGRGDTADTGVPFQGHLGRSFAASCAYGHVGISGDRLSTLLAGNAKRLSLAAYFTHIALNMGINDITNGDSAATVATNTNAVIALFGAKPVALCTLSPVTTSTDAWATAANQAVVATNGIRITENARRLSGVTGAKVVYDVNPQVETVASPESGIWKAPGFTADGTHPAAGGYKAEVAAINTTLLLSY